MEAEVARILLIDDDDTLRGLIKALLERRSHEVIEARDGIEGLERALGESIDLIITDIVMPGKEGIETIREFRAENQKTKILAISGGGNSRLDYLSMARQCGVNDTLKKPFTPPELFQAVERLLG
jgi:DNA-binding response OmpR family regulator